MMLELLSKMLVWGLIGLLIEIIFTGLHNVVIDRNLRAMGTTYLWMLPVYGLGAEALALLRDGIQNAWVFVPLAVVAIYAIEFSTGWILEKVIGRCPWDYGNARFGIMGLVRLDYLPFWLGVALLFDQICDKLVKIVQFALFHV